MDGHSRVVGGSDRSGVAVAAAWAAGTAAWAAGTAAWAAGTEANKDRTDGAMEQRSAANSDRGVPAAAVDGLESGFRVFESSTWRPTGSTSSPWADKKSKPRMGLYTAVRKKVTKNVRSPNERRRRVVPHVGIDLPSAPESCGPVGGVFERCGRQCFGSVFINRCLLSSSVAVGMVVANVAVLLIRARRRRAGRRAAASVVRPALSAGTAGNSIDWRIIDGGDGVAPPPRV